MYRQLCAAGRRPAAQGQTKGTVCGAETSESGMLSAQFTNHVINAFNQFNEISLFMEIIMTGILLFDHVPSPF